MKGIETKAIQLTHAKITRTVCDDVTAGIVRTTITASGQSKGRTLLFQVVRIKDENGERILYKRQQMFADKNFYFADFFKWMRLAYHATINFERYGVQ